MRVLLILLPAVMFAQAPPPPKAAATPATPAKAAAATTGVSKAAAPGTAAPGTAAPGRGAPGRGAPGRGAPGRGAIAAKPAAPKPLTTDDEKTIYALGLSIAKSLTPFDLTPAEIDIVKRALVDSAANKLEVKLEDWGPKIEPMAKARGARVAEKEKASSAAYCVKAAAEPGAVKTDSGMIIKELTAGAGASPKATDTVKVNYRGTLINGTEFDSSYKRNQPASFALNGVIPCWTEGVQRMKVGGKSMLTCPSNLAYGDLGRPSIPGGATLIFEIELLEIGGK